MCGKSKGTLSAMTLSSVILETLPTKAHPRGQHLSGRSQAFADAPILSFTVTATPTTLQSGPWLEERGGERESWFLKRQRIINSALESGRAADPSHHESFLKPALLSTASAGPQGGVLGCRVGRPFRVRRGSSPAVPCSPWVTSVSSPRRGEPAEWIGVDFWDLTRKPSGWVFSLTGGFSPKLGKG